MLILPAAAASVLLMAAPAGAASASKVYQAGSCHAEGEYAVCVASGTAYEPTTIRLQSHASPNQRVTVYWSAVCSEGLGAGSSSGHFTARTPLNRKIRHPYARPGSCDVAADVQLSGGHYVRLWITYRR